MIGAFEEKLFLRRSFAFKRRVSDVPAPCCHNSPCLLFITLCSFTAMLPPQLASLSGMTPQICDCLPVPVTPQSSVTKSRMWCVTICVTMAAIHLTMSFVVDQLGAWRRQPFPPVRSLQTINYLKTFKTLLHLAPKQYLCSPRSGSFCQQESKKPQNCFKGNVSEYCS